MTTKQEKLGRCYTVPVTKPRDEYSLGLTGAEALALRNLFEHLQDIGIRSMDTSQTIRNIYRKLKENLPNYVGSSDDSNHQQQLRELKQTLQEYRRKLSELEDRLDELEVEGALL